MTEQTLNAQTGGATETIAVTEAPKIDVLPKETVATESQVKEESKEDVKESLTTEKTELIDPNKEKVNAYNARKEKELAKLRQENEEKSRLLEQLRTNPPQEGEIFDPVLGQNISKSMPVLEYQALMAAKMQEQERIRAHQEMIGSLKAKVDVLREKLPDINQTFQYAAASGMVDDYLFHSAASLSKSGPEGIEFLHNLIKENPQKLMEIQAEGVPVNRTIALNNLYHEYKNKPAARVSQADAPEKPLNEKAASKDFLNTDTGSSGMYIDINKFKSWAKTKR